MQILQPLHPEVLRPRPQLVPIPNSERGGIALDDYGRGPQGQIRPERVVYTPEERSRELSKLEENMQAEDIFQSAYMIRDRDPGLAARMFLRVIRLAESTTLNQKAKNQLKAIAPQIKGEVREMYLQGYQLKATDAARAQVMFEDVVTLTEDTQELFEYFEKANAQLLKLKHQ